jgi:mannose-6-phosphate isomerase-like protein (cupin superfamily)
MLKELQAILPRAAKGRLHRDAVAALRRQMRAWGIAPPPSPPLVWDFGLGEFPRTGLIELWVCNERKAGYCAKYLFCFDGQTCPEHRHRVKAETFLVLKGRFRVRCGGRARILTPGDTLFIPAGRWHSFTAIGPSLLLEVSMPCTGADNAFRDRRIQP